MSQSLKDNPKKYIPATDKLRILYCLLAILSKSKAPGTHSKVILSEWAYPTWGSLV